MRKQVFKVGSGLFRELCGCKGCYPRRYGAHCGDENMGCRKELKDYPNLESSPLKPKKSIKKKETKVQELERRIEKLEGEKDFWYIDLNGRVQYKSYMPIKLDEGGVWFGNKFDTCNKAIRARDEIKKLLNKLNPPNHQ